MPLITQANYLSLGEVYRKLNLKKSSDRNFFHEWRDVNSALSEQDCEKLDQLKDELQGIQEYPTDVEVIKMYGLGSVLRLAGMAKDPFLPSAGYRIEIDLNNGSQNESVIHSNVEVIITHPNLWAIVIETNRSSPNVLEALPQALTHMVASKENDRPIYGLCTNGTEFIFVKLIKSDVNQYALSSPFSIYDQDSNKLFDVVSILKHLTTIVV
jgi:hypothetical protein